MNEPQMYSYEWFAQRQAEQDAETRTFLGIPVDAPLPLRRCGISTILLSQASDSTTRGVNRLLMVPVSMSYDALVLFAEWNTSETGLAFLTVLWTVDEFPCETSHWEALGPLSVPSETLMATPLGVPCDRNMMRLYFTGVGGTTVGVRLDTRPADARIDAKIRTMLIGGKR